MTTLDNSKWSGRMIGGHRLYIEGRGKWHVQHPTQPNHAWYSGTLREIERAMKSRSVRVDGPLTRQTLNQKPNEN